LVLLERHNEVGHEILGADDDAILFLHHYGARDEFASAFAPFGWAREAGIYNAVLMTFAAVDDDLDAVVGASPIHWSTNSWDELIRDVADENIASVVLYNPTSGEVYAPYDGGADVFVATPHRAAELGKRWAQWLSSHPSGL
jgi:hypothetical protein